MAKKLKRMLYLCPRCRERKPRDAYRKSKQTSNGLFPWCRECHNKWQRDRYQAMTPEQKEARRKADRERYERNKEHHWKGHVAYRFRMSAEEFQQRLAEQGGKCAACGDTFTARPQVDHDHTCCTGKERTCGLCVRGLLCRNCNSALGHARDSIERLYSLITYLKKWN